MDPRLYHLADNLRLYSDCKEQFRVTSTGTPAENKEEEEAKEKKKKKKKKERTTTK
jgi:hypothetical protein